VMKVLPAGWTLRGVARGPRDEDPPIQGTGWVAWAAGSGEERMQGAGGTPEDALQQLRVHLREFATLTD
jgi:hypothetical protein